VLLDEEFMVAGDALSEPEFVLSLPGVRFMSLTGHEWPSSNPGLGFAFTELLLDPRWFGFGSLCRLGREPKLLLEMDEPPRLSGESILLAFSGDEFIRAMCKQSVSFGSYHKLAQSHACLLCPI
jgi:hypothetical protein